MIPVTRFKVFGFALFAKVAAIRAQIQGKDNAEDPHGHVRQATDRKM